MDLWKILTLKALDVGSDDTHRYIWHFFRLYDFKNLDLLAFKCVVKCYVESPTVTASACTDLPVTHEILLQSCKTSK